MVHLGPLEFFILIGDRILYSSEKIKMIEHWKSNLRLRVNIIIVEIGDCNCVNLKDREILLNPYK